MPKKILLRCPKSEIYYVTVLRKALPAVINKVKRVLKPIRVNY